MARLREFDTSKVLHEILIMFWKHGSIDLSIDHIASKLNLSKTSLYNAFGSKDDLVMSCIDHYYEKYDLELISSFQGPSLSAATNKLLQFAEERFKSKKLPRGCFLINCIIEKNRMSEKLNDYIEKISRTFFKDIRDRATRNYPAELNRVPKDMIDLEIKLYGLSVKSISS